MLRAAGFSHLLTLQDSRQVIDLVRTQRPLLILLDLSMPHRSGEELLQELRQSFPDTAVIIVTAANELDTAVRCMRDGAFDYMVKPVEPSRMVNGVRRAVELFELRQQYNDFKERVLSDTLEHPEAFTDIVTNNTTMLKLFQYLETVAATSQPILITGETGVGKELMARAAHQLSHRSGPFVDVNVAGLDDTIFSDTLFGHTRGAFTGAETARSGLIEQAADGTLLLDEIGDLSQPSQVKLLRLLQENRYLPLGSDVPKKNHARILATTNRDLKAMQEAGTFRSDLYYRLVTHHLALPPLRNRRDDIPLLLDHFLEKSAAQLDKRKPTAPPELVTLLQSHPFPGNLRELEGMVFDAVSKHRARVLSMERFINHIAPEAPRTAPSPAQETPPTAEMAFPETLPTLQEMTDRLICEALRRTDDNHTQAARLLGMSRPTLSRRVKQLRNPSEPV